MELNESPGPRFQIDTVSGIEARGLFSALLDRAFQVPAGGGFLEDFPIWDETVVPSGEDIARIGVFTPERELVACAGVRMARLAAPHGVVSVALIGAVATDENHRGYGLASNLVSVATEWSRARGAAAIFLWGSEHGLYQRLGFELCGTQVMIPLDRLSFEVQAPEPLQQGWNPAILNRMMKRYGGLALQKEDSRWIAAHRNVKWFWVGDPDAPRAYVAIGRGIDLTGMIHEWGGERKALQGLLCALRRLMPGLTLLGSPRILEAFGIPCGSFEPQFLCLARVLDPVAVIRGFDPAAAVPPAPEGGLGRAIFGPLGSELGEPLVPLWIWGLDAV